MDKIPNFAAALAMFAASLAAPAWPAEKYCDKNHYILREPCETPGTFTPGGDMTTPRVGHRATLLLDGRVLIAGGYWPLPPGPMSSAELYDPATGAFVATGSMIQPRYFHCATLLTNGKVLIAGGRDDTSAELYDPATGSFWSTGEMLVRQNCQTAVLLTSGKVLVVGDVVAELYDATTGRFAPAGPYGTPIYNLGTATLLGDGRVLRVGDEPAQLYDPVTNTFSLTGSLAKATNIYGLELHSATLLGNGKVLVAGGTNDEVFPAGRVAAAALYDPATGAFRATSSMNSPRDAHAAVLLPDGKVLIVGGETGNSSGYFAGSLALAELFDPSSESFAATGSMATPRSEPTATLLKSGQVLVTGGVWYCGINCSLGSLATTEIYHPHMPPLRAIEMIAPPGAHPEAGTPPGPATRAPD